MTCYIHWYFYFHFLHLAWSISFFFIDHQRHFSYIINYYWIRNISNKNNRVKQQSGLTENKEKINAEQENVERGDRNDTYNKRKIEKV